MSLKFPFKFKHSMHKHTFMAILDDDLDGNVKVCWDDVDGEQYTEWYLGDVEHYVNNGQWKIIEEPTIDPLVTIRQSEYDELIEEVNLLQELLSETNIKLVDCLLDKMGSITNNISKLNQSIPEPTVFKPIAEYTMRDWEQALVEKWVFKQRDGSMINIIGLDYSDTSYKVETETAWLRLDGTEYDFGASDSDIVERIK